MAEYFSDASHDVVNSRFIESIRENTKYLYIEEIEQLFVKNCTSKWGAHYICKAANCRIRVLLNEDGVCFHPKQSTHNHSSAKPEYLKMVALKELIEDKASSIKSIFDEVKSR